MARSPRSPEYFARVTGDHIRKLDVYRARRMQSTGLLCSRSRALRELLDVILKLERAS